MPSPRVAVLIPCYNEAECIGLVAGDFRKALPEAAVYVYDNNSTDETAARARAAGAIVRSEGKQGKGNVVRRMFADIQADVFIIVDGDNTYDASAAPAMVEMALTQGLDMVVGCRDSTEEEAYRAGHRFGNWLFTTSVAKLFGVQFSDILSGYRVLSRRFVKSFPSLTQGFEIETEITVHALTLGVPTGEMRTRYGSRPKSSPSKLRTYSDGAKILATIIRLFRGERPLLFYSLISATLALLSVIAVVPIIQTYLETGLVPRFPTLIVSAAVMLLASLSLICGWILDTVTRGRREFKRLAYLAIPLGQEVPHTVHPSKEE